jgi:hypothetical protein
VLQPDYGYPPPRHDEITTHSRYEMNTMNDTLKEQPRNDPLSRELNPMLLSPLVAG